VVDCDNKKLMQSNRNSISYQKKAEKCKKNKGVMGKGDYKAVIFFCSKVSFWLILKYLLKKYKGFKKC